MTWNYDVQEFNEQYYTHFHRDKKRQEFFRLKQFGRTVTEYETELRELSEFVLIFANFEKYLYSKFEEDLSLEIREKMSITCAKSASQPLYSNVFASKVEITHMGRTLQSLSNSNFGNPSFRKTTFFVKQSTDARWVDNQSTPKITSKSHISKGIRFVFNTTPSTKIL